MKKTVRGLIIAAGFFVISASRVDAAYLDFDPKTINASVNQTFQVDVLIDADGGEILSTDARITYDPTIFTCTSVSNGTYFDIPKADCTTTPGKCYIAGIVNAPGDFQQGSGVLATITCKGIKAGSAQMSYVCNPGETARDSNIANNEINVQDVINCQKNGRLTVNVGGVSATATPAPTSAPVVTTLPRTGITSTPIPTSPPVGGPDPTATPTATIAPTISPTASTLPTAGIEDDLRRIAIPGFILLFIGMSLKLLL